MRYPTIRGPLRLIAALALVATAAPAQQATSSLTSPTEQFGHQIGADYVLPDYTQFVAYWEKLARQSDRMVLDTIGRTAEGRPQLMAIVTSPANHARLDRYQAIARRLALAEGVDSAEARRLAQEGKAVVWVDGGLHATEVLGAQQLMELVWQMVSRNDPETMRLLDDVILLAVHANPDGMELVSDWYMRIADSTKRSTSGIPRLYQKYIGHDNNRDFYMVTQPETENMTRVMYHEWFPQIVYNHHQTGPSGTVLFAPPFRDPFSYFYDPLVVTGIDLVGAAMHNRFVAENKPGATSRRGASYSTWWNGGLRTTVYFHNMIGLLTETIGNPTPIEIPFLPNRQLPNGDLVYPIAPQPWRFRQSVDYSITANRAVLDVASRHREQFLYNIWRMGKNSIDRGTRDHWTVTPSDIERVRAAARDTTAGRRTDAMVGGGIRERGLSEEHWRMLHTPDERDPRGYIIPSDQPDFPTATKFVNALIKTGVAVHRATAPFTVQGKQYPAGSYVVKTAQAFRPHVLDMFEPQDHPNDFQYPGGPPIPPYDNAGWTLAYQMGVEFDRILEGFDGPFTKIQGLATPPPGEVTGGRNVAGWLLDRRANDAVIAVNRLLKGGHDVWWVENATSADGEALGLGAFFVAARGVSRPSIDTMAKALGVDFHGIASRPGGQMTRVRAPRIALWDQYGGSMPSGWVRWILEQYEFPFEVVYPPQLDAGNLGESYDVIVFVDGAIPSGDSEQRRGSGSVDTTTVPPEWRARMGRVTVERTIPQLRTFLEQGGTVLTIGSSTHLAEHLALPISSALVADGKPLSREQYYIPGSVLEMQVDSTLPIAHGLDGEVDVFFDNSPVFRLGEDAATRGVRPIAWFDEPTPLRSGWAWGQQYLHNGVAAAQAKVGRGTLYLFGPEITFRAQPHGTFKFLFNGLYLGAAGRPVAAAEQ